jgi:hypothetical protein
MRLFGKNIDKDKMLYGGLIITFIILYASTAFVSWYHAITFFNIANAVWLSVLLSFVAEIGQASVLFSILLTDNKKKFLPWAVMIILTTLQVIGNVVSSYDWIIKHNGEGVESFQKSILFFMTAADPEIFKVVIAWISGALLPIIALSMTALVAQNMELRGTNARTALDGNENQEAEPPIEPIKVDQINATDIISEVSRIRPTQEDLDNLDRILKEKVAVKKEETKHPLGFTDEDVRLNKELVKEEIGNLNKFMFESPGVPTVEKEVNQSPSMEQIVEVLSPEDKEYMRNLLNDELPPVEQTQMTDEELQSLEEELKDADSPFIPHYSDEEVAEMNLDEYERTGSYHEYDKLLDEEIERLSYPVNHEPQIDLLKDLAEKKAEVPKLEEVLPEKEPEQIPKINPEEEEKKRVEEQRLERIRQIAQDNLKKK